MSSTERAEPTMEDILVSIDGTISETKPMSRRRSRRRGRPCACRSEELEADPADPQIIADIERVLSGRVRQRRKETTRSSRSADLGTPIEA